MKKQIKTTEAIFPMPVLLISTFNEDGTVDVMNAAWGTMLESDMVALNLSETHKTVENIKERKGFVIHIADAKHVAQADWFGVVSGKDEKERNKKNDESQSYIKNRFMFRFVILAITFMIFGCTDYQRVANCNGMRIRRISEQY